jgi:hypothetical protein
LQFVFHHWIECVKYVLANNGGEYHEWKTCPEFARSGSFWRTMAATYESLYICKIVQAEHRSRSSRVRFRCLHIFWWRGNWWRGGRPVHIHPRHSWPLSYICRGFWATCVPVGCLSQIIDEC